MNRVDDSDLLDFSRSNRFYCSALLAGTLDIIQCLHR